MDDSTRRKRRFRERRQQAGPKAALVWLSPAGQAAMSALRQPGETLDACFNRVLVALHQVRSGETSPVPK
jgi:hypothetical protein